MIFSTLESNSIQGHEAAIGVFAIIRKYLDDATIRKLVLPKAKQLFYKSSSVQVQLSPDVQNFRVQEISPHSVIAEWKSCADVRSRAVLRLRQGRHVPRTLRYMRGPVSR